MKDIKKLLAADLKRFTAINEYNFYSIPDDINEDDEDLEDEFPEPANPEAHDAEAVAPEGDVAPEGGPEPNPADLPAQDAVPEDLPAPEGEINTPEEAPMDAEVGGDEIELDVTDIVQKSEEAKNSSDEANLKIDSLMAKLGELESKLPSMDMIGQKIADLQKEIEARNPSEVEKLEMRSLNSFPYNLKLTDYWNDDETEVDNGEGQEIEPEEEEFVLKKDDIDMDYSEGAIKNSFDYKEEDI